jgi:hypothetical protein
MSFFWIDIARLFDPIGSGEHILQIAAAHIEKIRLLKSFSVSSRSAIVGRDHDVSLIRHVLHEAIERIHRLRRRAAVNVDNRRMFRLARQVVRHIDKRRNRPLAIFAGIVDKIRFDHIFGSHAAHQRVL